MMQDDSLAAAKTALERFSPSDEREEIFQQALLVLLEVVQRHEEIVGPMYMRETLAKLRDKLGERTG